ncbi:MAG: hypothetical protein KGJ23_09895 [Euryarchaeota archaeon]|nr:hypothetical protein [Euryarchaeota archaeon]MDE1881298.1 hypothetical protein [Euryarchaeota archaeon]MDE2045100.1 hypothetical protein [Thermoplasmata archaeon]
MSAPKESAFQRDLHRSRRVRAARWAKETPEEAAAEANRDAGRALQLLAERRAKSSATHAARRGRRAVPA